MKDVASGFRKAAVCAFLMLDELLRLGNCPANNSRDREEDLCFGHKASKVAELRVHHAQIVIETQNVFASLMPSENSPRNVARAPLEVATLVVGHTPSH